MLKNLFILILVLIPLKINFPQGQSGVFYTTLPESKVWIDGTSTINDFTCTTIKVNGYGYIVYPDSLTLKETLKNDKGILSLKVKTLDCGKERMNEDMFEAMKAEQFPLIKFDLVEPEVSTKIDSSTKVFNVRIKGKLFLAGKSNLLDMILTITRLDSNKFRVQGNTELSMLDYNIEPPSAFFGLIKAHEELTVFFDLVVKKTDNLSLDK